jgi:hypothetical protein
MEEFAGVLMSLVEVLKQKMSARLITLDSLLVEFNESKPQFDYVCIARQYHIFEIKSPNRIGGIKPNPADVTTLLCTSCDFVIYDLKKKCIIFRHKNTVGQALYLISKDRLLVKNAASIKKDMHKALSEYLQLQE